MYKPAAQRRWGYSALPILHHDQLVGKLDATADRKSSTLRVHAIHQDIRFTRVITAAVDAEIEALASRARPGVRRSGRQVRLIVRQALRVASHPTVAHPDRVPFYMDRHDFSGLSALDAANMHLKDLEMQGQFGVEFITYWFDYDRQTAFCLAKAPNGDAIEEVHREAHGAVPGNVIEVDERAAERFMGGIVAHQPGEPYVETAFRTILFTDMEGSTSLTQRLGDAGAMTVLREHDRIVGEAINGHGGSEVKHTGDGLMASFPSVVGAIESAIQIQRQLAEAGGSAEIHLRIGMAAGEPVTERDDLFGAVVQLAARLCSRAEPGSVLVSSAVRDLALGKGFEFRKRGRLSLKGLDEPVQAFEVIWQPPPSAEAAP